MRPAPLLCLAAIGAALASCAPDDADGGAVRRGDVAFAQDSLPGAIAEYGLAVRQGGEGPELFARVAHTNVELARVEEASSFYRRAVEADSTYADVAAADFVRLARQAADRDDGFLMASAMDEARTFVPGLGVPELMMPLARHHFQNGEYGRALPLYQRALEQGEDSVPEVVFEIAQAHEQIGDCASALDYFERYRGMVRPWERAEVDWYIGKCSFEVGREKASREESTLELEEALALLERTIDLGEPRNVQGQAWFEKGEILSLLGDCSGALEAFAQVRFYEPSRATALARRAQRRFDDIQFGRDIRDLRGTCG